MASEFANNSKINERIPGAPWYLEVKPFTNIPLEGQVSLPVTYDVGTTAGVVTNSALAQGDPNVVCGRNLTTGSVTYSISATDANNLHGRDSVVVVNPSVGAGNTVSVTLPAGWYFLYQGAASPLVKQTATSPVLGAVVTALSIRWIKNNGVAGGVAVITSPVTGWTFP